MSNQFITNEGRLLSEVINKILPSSKSLYFLVGYFYFSGIEEIYSNIQDKKIKILVGLNAERDIYNKIKEYELFDENNKSRAEIRQNIYDSFTDIFNRADYFDSAEKQKAFRIFYNKIKDGSLEIRKTFHPNHAKLYLFEKEDTFSEEGEYPGIVITGSSNLSYSGLRGRHEINVVFRDEHFKEGLNLFNNLWQESIVIADHENIDDFNKKVIEKLWIDKKPSPFHLYIKVLLEYFTIAKQDNIITPAIITKDRFQDLKYQVDAISKAISIINRHNGVIIADVVGLGKSIIASAIAFNLKLGVLVISPPHLKSQWEDYSFDFNFRARVYSSGKIKQALEENDGEPKLIIIDEAHKYRNEDTEDYANLHKLCQNNKVMLLSATPFNNRPQDIFSLIKLFQIPTKSTIRTVDNLSYQFSRLILEYKKIKEEQKKRGKTDDELKIAIDKLASKIRDILSPLIIRRSRIDLDIIDEYKEDLEHQGISFPKVNDPEVLEYKLGDLASLYIDTFYTIAPGESGKGFIGARYMPSVYIKNPEEFKKKNKTGYENMNLFEQSQRNIAGFMKHLLVRRFESSIFAFQKTLDSIITSSERIKEYYNVKGIIPIYKKGNLPSLSELTELNEEDVELFNNEYLFDEAISLYKEKGLITINKDNVDEQFILDLEKDIKLLKEIRANWFGHEFPKDPKLKDFKTILRAKLKENPKRKIVVFTEFNDTAIYLNQELEKDFKIFKYSSEDSSEKNKQIIKSNFDAGIAAELQANDYDILIATDAISEGFNLHQAGIIINYDIPYNPTRVIQRVGRINRINKKVFDELFIYNFFPSAEGQQHTFVTQITALKLAMIQALIGEDTRVLTKDEEIRSFFADSFKKEMKELQEQASWDAVYLNELNEIKRNNKADIELALKIPHRVRIKRSKQSKRKGVLVFGKKGEEYIFKLGDSPSNIAALSSMEALELFKAAKDEKPEDVSAAFEDIYQRIKRGLFIAKTETAFEKGKRETIRIIKTFIDSNIGDKDYLKDLYYMISELDSLPELYHKLIRSITLSSPDEGLRNLMEQVPHDYITSIIKQSERIDNAPESLILSEELI